MEEIDKLERIITVFKQITEQENITIDSHLINDLELSSLESFQVLGELEREFDIHIPEKMVRKMMTIKDVLNIINQIME